MPRRLQITVPPESGAPSKKAVDWPGYSTPDDPVEQLDSLYAPTADIDQILTEIETGRV